MIAVESNFCHYASVCYFTKTLFNKSSKMLGLKISEFKLIKEKVMHENNPVVVSVILPVYNGSHKICKAIDSVLIQRVNFELLIIDDGSTDDIDSVIGNYNNESINYFKMGINCGVAKARNFGVMKAQAQFIAFIDADDIWQEGKLDIQINQMLLNKWSLSYCSFQRISDTGKVLNTVSPRDEVTFDTMLLNNSIATSSACVTTELAKKVLFMQIGHEDYAFWVNILQLINAGYKIQSDIPLVYYTVSSESLSANKFKAILWQWKNYRKNLKLSFLKSVYCFSSYIMLAIKKRIVG